MFKYLSGALVATTMALGAIGNAHATSYEYHFLVNPGADDTAAAADPALDVAYTFGFNASALPGYDLSVLNNVANWTSGAIWLKATYQGQTVNFADGLDTQAPGLQFVDGSGVIEAFSDPNEFLDVDLHGNNPLVEANHLPFDPFVGGQLDVYNDQQQFKDAFAVWTAGDLSSLSAHAVVPEPSSLASLTLGLLAIGGLLRKRQ